MSRAEHDARVRQHLTSCRMKNPLPSRQSFFALEEEQCRVLGGHLIRWLSNWGPVMLAERAALSAMAEWDPNPLICFHSILSGLVAAEEILGDEVGSVVWGLSEEFATLANKDEAFRYHVELHSEFGAVPPQTLGEELTAKYPLSRGECYLIHREESVLGPLFARGAQHLWKWNGFKLELLEEEFVTWAS